MQVKVLVDLFLDLDFIRNDKILGSHFIVVREVFGRHLAIKLVLWVVSLHEQTLNVLISRIFEEVKQLHSPSLQIESKTFLCQLIYFLVDRDLLMTKL